MVLSDILFDRSDCRFLLGERYAGREIRSIHLIASIHDLPHMERSSLLFVTPSFFSRPFPLSLFFSLVIQANVAGVALVGQAELSLPPALREQLLDREIFIFPFPQVSITTASPASEPDPGRRRPYRAERVPPGALRPLRWALHRAGHRRPSQPADRAPRRPHRRPGSPRRHPAQYAGYHERDQRHPAESRKDPVRAPPASLRLL